MMAIEECREFYARELLFAVNLTTPGLEHFLGSGPWQLGSAEGRPLSAAGMAQLPYLSVDDPPGFA